MILSRSLIFRPPNLTGWLFTYLNFRRILFTIYFFKFFEKKLDFFLNFQHHTVAFGNLVLRVPFIQVLHKTRYQIPEIFQIHLMLIYVTTGTCRHTVFNTIPVWIPVLTISSHTSPYGFQMIYMPAFT